MLNSGVSGRMQCNLVDYGKPHARMKDAMVFYILKRGKVASWAVVYHPTISLGNYSKRWEMDIYTRLSERDKGYGNAVAETVREEFKDKKITACRTMTSLYKRNRI